MIYLGQFWNKFLNIEGRCSRRTYWTTIAINLAIGASLFLSGLFLHMLGTGNHQDLLMYAGMAMVFAALVYFVISIVPWVCMSIRRLHDRNMKGWFMLLAMFPAVQIFLLAMMIAGPRDAGNRWGLNSE